MYRSQLSSILQQFLHEEDYNGLLQKLESMSHADFRRSSQLLGECILPLCPEKFWKAFSVIVPSHTKVYLGTFLKAAAELTKGERQFWHNEYLEDFLRHRANEIDSRKCAEAFLPLLTQVEDAEIFLSWCTACTPDKKALWLLHTATPTAYFLLFRHLRGIEDDNATLRKYCLALIKRGDSLSFNMACIIQDYFGLPQLPATFSLRLPPYQYSRLEKSYEVFLQTLSGQPAAEAFLK